MSRSHEVLPFVLPLRKVDARTGAFEAAAAIEVRDGAGEKCDYASSRPHFEALEKRCLSESGGKKVAPLREMHQLKAAGKVTDFAYDDPGRVVTCHGTITDADSLRKALDGTLCGVSMGGLKRYLSYDADGSRRYTAIPKEISLVDLGEIPGSGITMLNAAGACEVIQADGSVRVLERAARTDDPNPKAGEQKYGDVTFADPENKKYPLDTEARIRAAWNYIHKPKNAAKYADQGKSVKRKIIAAWKKKIDAAGPPSAEHLKKVAAAIALHKADGHFDPDGLYIAARVAEIVTQLAALHEMQEAEEAREGDDDAAPLSAQFAAAVAALGEVLVALVQEEVDELTADDEPDDDAPMANATDAMRGLRKRVQRMHDCSVEMGAACTAPPMSNAATRTGSAGEEDPMKPEELQELAKAVHAELGLEKPDGILAKAIGQALGVGQADGPLAKAIGTAVTPALEKLEKATGTKLEELSARIKHLEDQPAASPGALLALGKAADGLAATVVEQEALQKLAQINPVEAAKLLARMPGNAFHVGTTGVAPIAG